MGTIESVACAPRFFACSLEHSTQRMSLPRACIALRERVVAIEQRVVLSLANGALLDYTNQTYCRGKGNNVASTFRQRQQ